jgi:hypothetical protein
MGGNDGSHPRHARERRQEGIDKTARHHEEVGQSLLRESGQNKVTTHGHRWALAVSRFGTRAMAKRGDRRAQGRGICVAAIRLSPATAR